ncbi:alpha/beta hydrolase-fold protein [Tenacibaculum sp. UWU-22]|uniref:alpha/beta hydrolase-fold protein n=1 Tax=Tenacibaculum sp. UWU-22 TaxID=3234187 RepID=UPI0034DB67A3
MKNTILILFLTINLIIYSQNKKLEIQKNKYIVDSIYSTNIGDYRKIKIFLPTDYSKNKKYPIIYVLDGKWMFEPTVFESKILMDFEVIPKSIIIGIFHKNRNKDLGINWETGEFEKNSLKFFNFLNQELVPKINTTYPSSGFNVLIGHSNSATFCAKVITQKEQPFEGFVALSQNLFGTQLEEYIRFTKQTIKKPIFYFVASGTRDATPRLKSGMQLDSLFKKNINTNIIAKHVLYDADHSGIAGKGLNNGISHMFSEYKHYNDWNDKLIDSLISKNISPLTFIEEHSKKMKTIYGIDFKVNQDDLSLMQAMTQNDSDIKAVQDFEIKHLGISKEFYATYAQFYEYVKSYDKALDYWSVNLEKHYKEITNFFYYRRPIDLLYKKMNQPKKAIAFAEKWKKKSPEFSSYFNLKIANIALESGSEIKNGLKAIQEYINNYQEGFSINLKKAKEIENKLKKINM